MLFILRLYLITLADFTALQSCRYVYWL